MYYFAWEYEDGKTVDVGMPHSNYEDILVLVDHLIYLDSLCGNEAQYFICEV